MGGGISYARKGFIGPKPWKGLKIEVEAPLEHGKCLPPADEVIVFLPIQTCKEPLPLLEPSFAIIDKTYLISIELASV